tara:strand:+ start:20935 stop:23160 length:2226 start_codon:yes stop_codon:yes gene_type:complete
MKIADSNNSSILTKIEEQISNKNFLLILFVISIILFIPLLFMEVRIKLGILPLNIATSILLIGTLYKFSINKSKKIITKKLLVSFVLINFSIFILLGTISYNSSANFSFDYSLSGIIGEKIAKAPSNWSLYNASLINYVDVTIRIITPLLFILIIYNPKKILELFINSLKVVVLINKFTLNRLRDLMTKKKLKKNENIDSSDKGISLDKPIDHIEITEAKDLTSITYNENSKQNLEKEIININNIDREIPIKKEILEENDLVETELLRYLTKNNKWPKIKTHHLSISPKKDLNKSEINDTIQIIKNTLSAHGVDTSIENYISGPSVTMYQLKPGWVDGEETKRVKVDQILRREKDLALALGSPNIRFEPVVDGIQDIMGIEIPNISPNIVDFREVMEDKKTDHLFDLFSLPAPMGKGMNGETIVVDIAKMPHLLVAGSTGSGKSVFINSIISGLISHKSPNEVRMILIDPKRVELTPYSSIPHLYTDEVIVDTEKAAKVLSGTVNEMMNRFKIMEKARVKNITEFNNKMNNSHKMWNILVVIDELADLMLQAGNEIERLIVRLAQLGRATGIHLVVATQRPSVDVVTGLIKANFPSRVSFAVMSQIDSRTVLDSIGAEKLIGKGDMLFSPIDSPQMKRIQGVFLNEQDISMIINQWSGINDYELETLSLEEEKHINNGASEDSLYSQALELTTQSNTLSTSLLQRRLRIGYPRAARLMDELEENGIVGNGEPGKPRKVLKY